MVFPDPFPFGDGEPPQGPGHRLQQAAALVAILTFVSAMLLALLGKPNRKLILALAAIAVLALGWALLPELRGAARAISFGITRQLLIWRNASKLRIYAHKLQALTSQDSNLSLACILRGMCSSNQTELEKILPRDYIPDWLVCYKRQLLFRIVAAFNRDYVFATRQAIKDHPTLAANKHYQEEIEAFRDRYIRFLDSFEEWVNGINLKARSVPQHLVTCSFERPKPYFTPSS